jgi:hypothetical protein
LKYIPLFLAINCNSPSKDYSDSSNEIDFAENQSDNSEISEINELTENFMIDVPNLKNHPFIVTTSGVLPRSETNKFCMAESESKGFFGCYQLFDKNSYDYLGQLKVYTTDKPEKWKLDSENEIFVEIEIISNKIKLNENFGVGISRKKIIEFIGQNSYTLSEDTLETNIGSYLAYFTFKSDTVNWLKMGKYCKNK